MNYQLYDDDDDDELTYESPFDHGQWVWSNDKNGLEFIKENISLSRSDVTVLRQIGTSKFKNTPDVLEQLRFEKYYLRPDEGPDDVVTLQDVIDLTLFTAPSMLLKANIVNLLHVPGTHRFLRALIFYCQYFFQITDDLRFREQENKIRTPRSDIIELQFSENAADLRLLVAKEYTTLLLGVQGFSRFHHMGVSKYEKTISYTEKDAVLYESLFMISAHIVWIALGRLNTEDEIEKEVHRLFRSDRFNLAAHKYHSAKTSGDRSKTMGHCLRQDYFQNSTSPLIHEVFCHRDIDPRIFGLGVVKYPNLGSRLEYLKNVLILPENKLRTANISLGILGVKRKELDPMLKEIKKAQHHGSMLSIIRSTRSSLTRRSGTAPKKQLPQIDLPAKRIAPNCEDTRPGELYPPRKINTTQKKKWIGCVQRRLRYKGSVL